MNRKSIGNGFIRPKLLQAIFSELTSMMVGISDEALGIGQFYLESKFVKFRLQRMQFEGTFNFFIRFIGFNLRKRLYNKLNYKIMSSTAQSKVKQEALWENSYPMKKFLFELGFLLFTLYIWGLLIHHTLQSESNPLSVVLGFVIAQFLVDWVSGMLHWACDTWGQFSTPIVGPTLIRSFRMHHIDPQDITKHGFIETNASSCYPMPLFIFVGLQITPSSFFIQTYEWTIIFGVILGIFTNEFHKWAHMVHSKPHPIIRFLQNSRLILNHAEHHRHHQGEFDRAYCIINGWMNPFLQKIDYWRRMENLITRTTGAVPRADDNFWRKVKYDD